MARWTGDPNIENVLRAADAWRKRCVEADGSILSSEPLWTEPNLEDLKRRFVDNPILGTDKNFYEKLQQQLTGSTPTVKKLAAELIWFLLLFPHHSKFGPETKLEQIRTVWEWSGDKLPPSEYLKENSLMGVGNPGTAYLTRKFDQLGFALEVFHQWKHLSESERSRLMSGDPWPFVEWIDGIPSADRRPVRNAILYFLFPDELERNLSNDHRRQIVEAFKDKLPSEIRPKGKYPPLLQCDRAISALRKQFEKEFKTSELDFYRPPLHQLWWTGLREGARDEIASELKKLLSKYGLELRQCGNKKAKLSDCYEVDPVTGYWKNASDATNKPLRWLVHFEFVDNKLVAKLPGLLGDRRIAFANTAQGNSGAITARVIPVFKLKSGTFVFYETWEWLLLFAFSPALAAGSSGQLFEFAPNAGELKYRNKEQPYILAALIALNEEDDVLVSPDIANSIRYGEATNALASFVHVSQK